MQQFLIIGAGLAGHKAAIELRQRSKDVSITLLGDEAQLPYDRPPLTKEYLLGRVELDDLILSKARDYTALKIAFHPNSHVIALDPVAKTVRTKDGLIFPYDKLLIATGSRLRKLPFGPAGEPVHYIRTAQDAARLKDALKPHRQVCVIGAGFIGLEIAAAARMKGCSVSVIETADRVLSRGMPRYISDHIADLHRWNGVELVVGAAVTSLAVDSTERITLSLPDRSLTCDVVIAGVGVIPNTQLAEAAQIAVDDGILVDSHCRTSDPNVFAAGEVTRHPSGPSGRLQRIESWRVAAQQPAVAAQTMLGEAAIFDDPAWLWSDQFDTNIQVIGDPLAGSQQYLHPAPKAGGWTYVSVDDDMQPMGAVAINNGRDISLLRRVFNKRQALPDTFINACEHLEPGAKPRNSNRTDNGKLTPETTAAKL